MLSDAIIDAHYGPRIFSLGWPVRQLRAARPASGWAGSTLRRGAGRAPAQLCTLVAGSHCSARINLLLRRQQHAGLARRAGIPAHRRRLAPGVDHGFARLFAFTYVFFRNGLVSDALYSMVFVACVRLTLPRGERIRSSSPVVSAPDTSFADARRLG